MGGSVGVLVRTCPGLAPTKEQSASRLGLHQGKYLATAWTIRNHRSLTIEDGLNAIEYHYFSNPNLL